ncbi:CRISPR-associated endonuclease Cas2 [Candidatus Wolfebacteria bacterium]|nr:CRISPR-associated endonuclease Cas2 [Candidatus Wolfebacteria bacterium]
MSLSNILLALLTNYSGGYKTMGQRLRTVTSTYPFPLNYKKYILTQDKVIDKIKEIKEQTLRRTLSRLKKRGLIENKNNIWKITQEGRNYLKEKSFLIAPHFGYLKIKNTKKDMIVIFDIPEIRKKQRNWLRKNLTALGFIMLQESVWFGPSPLPKEFIEYLNETNLLQYLKFFKVAEDDII